MTDINSLKRTIATYINDHRDIVPSFLQRILISMLDASQANVGTLPIEEIVIDTENGDTIETAKTKVDTLTTLGFHILVAPEEVVPFTTPSKAIILSMDESESSGVQIATNTQGGLLLRYCSNAEWSEWAPISDSSDSSLLTPHPNDDVPINDFVKAGGLIWNTYDDTSSLPFSSDGFVVSLGWPSSDRYAIQLAFDDSSDSMYMRRRYNKEWKNWVQVYPSQGGGSTSTEATSLQKITLYDKDDLDSFLGEKMQYGQASSPVTGLPTDVLILSLGYSSNYGKQYAIDDESFRTWQRYKTLNSGWSEWVEINASSEFSLNLTPIGTLKRFDVKVYPVNNITVEYDKRIAYKTDVYGNILIRDIPDTELPNYALCLFYTTKTPTQSTPPFFGYVSRISLDTSLVDVLLGQVPIYVGDTRLNDYNNILDGSEGNVRACYGCYLAYDKKIAIIHTGTDTPNNVNNPNYYSTISRRFISRNYTKKYTEYEQCFEINFSNESNKEYVSLPLANTTKTFILSATGVLYRALDGEEEWVPVSFNNDSSKLTITPEGSFIRITKDISDAGFVPTCKAYITIRYIEYD